MPARDATGPLGQGPMTGRGLGPCVATNMAAGTPVNQPAGTASMASQPVNTVPVQNNVVPFGRPRRFFRARGRGFRGGRGRGRGRR